MGIANHFNKETYAELWELDGPRSVDVDLVDHVLDLGVRGVLTQRSHHRRELLEKQKQELRSGKKCGECQTKSAIGLTLV